MGAKHSLIDTNPFGGMYEDLTPSKPAPPVAFSIEERDGQRPAQRAIASSKLLRTIPDLASIIGIMLPS